MGAEPQGPFSAEGGWEVVSEIALPLDLAVQSPHTSGFQEADNSETEGGDTVHLSTFEAFPTFLSVG